MSDFTVSTESELDGAKGVTTWLPPDYKERYDRLQKLSRRKFAKKVRQLFMAAIDMADAKTG